MKPGSPYGEGVGAATTSRTAESLPEFAKTTVISRAGWSGIDTIRSMMSAKQAVLTEKLGAFGVNPSFIDAFGIERKVPLATLEQLEGTLSSSGAPVAEPLICTPGHYHPELYGTLTLESGEVIEVQGRVEVDGYHHLVDASGLRRQVISAPEFLPQPKRGWGWAVQLYAARSRESWGIGDFRDLGLIARKAKEANASSVLISPVHAAAPVANQQPSPYSPASRLWLQLLHIAPGSAPGSELVDLSDLSERGRALNGDRIIDRAKVWEVKQEALERIFEASKDSLPAEALSWISEQGKSLERFATWSVLAENMPSPDWRTWPAAYRRVEGRAVSEYAALHAERVLFYSWTQWVADRQFAEACNWGVDVIADLAVGFDSGSADAWIYQDQVVFDFEVGCPPDKHNTDGQRWGLPPFDPNALKAADFMPFIEMVRAGLRRAGALRIDHVMQLWRLFWVPQSSHAANGAYISSPAEALLAILRIEANRRGAWVVGEDMGTVADGVREVMKEIGMLGYRAAVRNHPQDFPECAMGASSTHDQMTVAGLLTGSDAADMKRIGKNADFAHIDKVRAELIELAGLNPEAEMGESAIATAVLAQYRALNQSPARVIVATLDDAGGVKERPNMPGTVDEWQNWRLALPQPVEDILDAPLAQELAEVLGENRHQ